MSCLVRSNLLPYVKTLYKQLPYLGVHCQTIRHHSDHGHEHSNHDHHSNHALYAQHLSNRGLVEVSGIESSDFLQGLISSDMNRFKLESGCDSIFTGMLNAQGRLLYDIILYNLHHETFWAECDLNIVDDLIKNLKRHRLRKKISIEDMSDGMKIWSIFRDISNTDVEEPSFIDEKFNLVFSQDPRLRKFGYRLVLPEHTRMENTIRNAYEVIGDDLYALERYKIGIAEGIHELPSGKAFPLESNFAYLNGVSFTKGCYVGQELTARTFHTGVTRKRIMPVTFTRSDVSVGASLKSDSGKNIGSVRAVHGSHGLGLVRISNLATNSVTVVDDDGTKSEATIHVPLWWPKEDDELKKVKFTLT